MKNKRRDIEIAWTDGLSNQHSIGNVFDLIMDNVRDMIGKREITKAQIRQHVDLSMEDGSEQYRTNHAYAIVEATLLALGWTIVDDDKEDGLAALDQAAKEAGLEIVSGEQAKRLRTLHETRDLLNELIRETSGQTHDTKPHETEWRPIEEVPDNECKLYIVGSKRYANGMEYAYMSGDKWLHAFTGILMQYQPTHYLPIPPLPENDK